MEWYAKGNVGSLKFNTGSSYQLEQTLERGLLIGTQYSLIAELMKCCVLVGEGRIVKQPWPYLFRLASLSAGEGSIS